MGACKGNDPVPLTLENLSAKGVTLLTLAPLSERPFSYVLISKDPNTYPSVLYLSKHLLSNVRSGKDQGSLIVDVGTLKEAGGFTTNPSQILALLGSLRSETGNGGLLFSAMQHGMKKLDDLKSDSPRFLFVVTDGRTSEATTKQEQLINALLSTRTHVVVVPTAPPSAQLRQMTPAEFRQPGCRIR